MSMELWDEGALVAHVARVMLASVATSWHFKRSGMFAPATLSIGSMPACMAPLNLCCSIEMKHVKAC